MSERNNNLFSGCTISGWQGLFKAVQNKSACASLSLRMRTSIESSKVVRLSSPAFFLLLCLGNIHQITIAYNLWFSMGLKPGALKLDQDLLYKFTIYYYKPFLWKRVKMFHPSSPRPTCISRFLTVQPLSLFQLVVRSL